MFPLLGVFERRED